MALFGAAAPAELKPGQQVYTLVGAGSSERWVAGVILESTDDGYIFGVDASAVRPLPVEVPRFTVGAFGEVCLAQGQQHKLLVADEVAVVVGEAVTDLLQVLVFS